MANEPVVKLRKKEYSSEADNQAGIITFDDESKGIYVGGERYGGEMNVQPDWNQTISTASDYIKNKPTLSTVATSGSYNDLDDKPTIGSGVLTISQNGVTVGTFSANEASDKAVNIEATVVSGVNDGTNWTSVTIGSTTKAIPSGGNATLSGLTDTAISSPSDGQVLKYNNSSSKWENANETKEIFICMFTADVQGQTISCDKSISDIKDAFNAGKRVIGIGDFANVFQVQDFYLITELTGVTSINQMAVTFSSTTDFLFAGLCIVYIKGVINENDDDEWEIGYLFDADDKNKLESVEYNAEPNVQSDWNETDTDSDAYILNKPTIPDVTGKADKVSSPTSGDLVELDANGNITDSGITATSVSTAVTNSHTHSNKTVLDYIPSSLGTAGQALVVNSGATGLEFATVQGGGGLTDYDFTELVAPTITSGAATVTFAANQRNGVEMTTNADLAIALVSNNKSDNYIWVTNSHSTDDIDVTFSSITFGATTINDVRGTDSLPTIGHGETIEISIYVTNTKARITSRIL